MSELLDKQVNAQKEKIFWGSSKLPQAHEKVCDESRIIRIRKNDTRVKMLFMEAYIRFKQKTGENNLHELLGNDYGYNEGTICVVNG